MDMCKRLSLRFTIGSASSIDANAGGDKSFASVLYESEDELLRIEDKLLCAARGLGTDSNNSLSSRVSIDANAAMNSCLRVGFRRLRNEKVEGSMFKRNPSRWAPE